MKIAVLTSSRADYSIYLPLLKKIKADPFFELSLIVFGTHVSQRHGYTIEMIRKDGFEIQFELEDLLDGDSPEDISLTMGRTMKKFSKIWSNMNKHLVFALGDRFEMFAAVASSVPFNIPIAHIHGGETTLGAIDDSFRHAITHMSKFHFPVTENYKKRIVELIGKEENVFNVGSLSYDNLKELELLSPDEFYRHFQIDLKQATILITFHPETVSYEKNENYISELLEALNTVKGYQFVITMPNSDTTGDMIREKINHFVKENPLAICVESLGTIGYLSCMKHCSFMLGNTSSGFAEAAYFPKHVINLGDRQKGRLITSNIKSIQIEKEEIIKAITEFESFQLPKNIQVYGDGSSAQKIIEILKKMHG